jgi:hypothetical protein
MRYVSFVIAALCAALLAAPASAADFSNWAAIVVAGDWHSHSGAPSEVFDNARKDVSADLTRLGFSPNNILQFSVRPERYPGSGAAHSDKQTIANDLWDLSNRTTGGCLAYFTSHGSPDGMVLNEGTLSPTAMAAMLDNACGSRPTVVFVVACFSGVFVDQLSGPNRFVMTAADRPSFGCGDNDHYTFFDNCWLDSVNAAGDFPTLASTIRACVTRKEAEIHAYPSEPQLSIGANVAAQLPHWR